MAKSGAFVSVRVLVKIPRPRNRHPKSSYQFRGPRCRSAPWGREPGFCPTRDCRTHEARASSPFARSIHESVEPFVMELPSFFARSRAEPYLSSASGRDGDSLGEFDFESGAFGDSEESLSIHADGFGEEEIAGFGRPSGRVIWIFEVRASPDPGDVEVREESDAAVRPRVRGERASREGCGLAIFRLLDIPTGRTRSG